MLIAREINDWIANGRDYERGRSIYEKHGRNVTLKRTFNRGPNGYNIEKLNQELLEMLAQHPEPDEIIYNEVNETTADAPVANEVQASIQLPASKEKQPIDITSLPEELRQRYILKGKLFREASYLQSQLIHYSEEDREEACRKIIDNFKTIDEIWSELDHYTATGEVLSKPEQLLIESSLPVSDPAKMQRDLLNIRSRISKALKKGDHTKADQLIVQRDELEKALGIQINRKQGGDADKASE